VVACFPPTLLDLTGSSWVAATLAVLASLMLFAAGSSPAAASTFRLASALAVLASLMLFAAGSSAAAASTFRLASALAAFFSLGCLAGSSVATASTTGATSVVSTTVLTTG